MFSSSTIILTPVDGVYFGENGVGQFCTIPETCRMNSKRFSKAARLFFSFSMSTICIDARWAQMHNFSPVRGDVWGNCCLK